MVPKWKLKKEKRYSSWNLLSHIFLVWQFHQKNFCIVAHLTGTGIWTLEPKKCNQIDQQLFIWMDRFPISSFCIVLLEFLTSFGLFFLYVVLIRPNIFDYAIKNDFVHTSSSKMLESIKLSLGLEFSGKNW